MNDAAVTTMLLIRHARTDAVDSGLSGREAVPLNQVGRAQADRLRHRLGRVNIAAVYSSPLDRALETAAGLAQERGLRVEPRVDSPKFPAESALPRFRRGSCARSTS